MITFALANLLATQEAKLSLADLQRQNLKKVVVKREAQGVEVIGTVMDVSSSAAVDDWIAGAAKQFCTNIAGIELELIYVFDLIDET